MWAVSQSHPRPALSVMVTDNSLLSEVSQILTIITAAISLAAIFVNAVSSYTTISGENNCLQWHRGREYLQSSPNISEMLSVNKIWKNLHPVFAKMGLRLLRPDLFLLLHIVKFLRSDVISLFTATFYLSSHCTFNWKCLINDRVSQFVSEMPQSPDRWLITSFTLTAEST